jgi:hypothetical protein
MLGIICVPATPPRRKLAGGGSGLAAFGGAAFGAAAFAGNNPAAAARADSGPLVTAFSNAPRCDATLLTASGETCGAKLGAPMPGAVAASSGDTGGGP